MLAEIPIKNILYKCRVEIVYYYGFLFNQFKANRKLRTFRYTSLVHAVINKIFLKPTINMC